MSTEVVLYPASATKEQLKRHLVSLGYRPSGHLWNWAKGSLHFHWFEEDDFKSTDGVEATIFPPSDEEQTKYGKSAWALHTRTRASASRFDKEHQNNTIRSARKAFGGNFYNDWFGKNRYTPLWEDKKGPAGRGIFLSYTWVLQNLGAVEFSVPQPNHGMDESDKISQVLSRLDPSRVLYNALVPFAVAALEHFFSQTFKILLRYDAGAQRRLMEQTRKVDMQEVLAISRGERKIEDVVADWYSFQNINSTSAAFREWFGIDIWKILRRRRRIGRRVTILEHRLNDLIQFRHGVVHRFEFDFGLTRDQIQELLKTAEVIIETFVDYLEQERSIKIRD